MCRRSMAHLAPLLGLLFLAAGPSPKAAPSPGPTPPAGGTLIFFLIDNSASLPPLDPDEKRVAALEKMFTFLQGQPYRLALFGRRKENIVHHVTRYRNHRLTTDYYFAFDHVPELMYASSAATTVRLIH